MVVKQMGKTTSVSYTHAGTARRSGRGLFMEISGARYYIIPEDIPALMVCRPVEVVDHSGEREGTAWLSPILDTKKQDLTALIREHLYVVGYRDLHRILGGHAPAAQVREYHPS
jgi:hypothetical protein